MASFVLKDQSAAKSRRAAALSGDARSSSVQPARPYTPLANPSMEASMGKSIPVLLSSAALAVLSATGASALPIASTVAPISGVEHIRLVCNDWGRCWRQPDYYRPYGYYRSYDDDWRYRYRYRGYGYHAPRWGYGWPRDRDRDWDRDDD